MVEGARGRLGKAKPMNLTVRHLGPNDLDAMGALLSVFAEAFAEPETYNAARPDPSYLARLLARDTFIALAAFDGPELVGGLAAYVLDKFEQERSEIYVYDLAVDASRRRRGIATALLRGLQTIASERGAWVIFIQADRDDAPAIALYSKLGRSEDVLHFDIPVPDGSLDE
jgi:aminoglycoside 3-N-acetyltransferase I